MTLKLERPIIFFDIESTGLNVAHDRIVELSYIKLLPSGEEQRRTLRFNPTIPISAEASAVNGITNEMVAQCPTFSDMSDELYQVFAHCDLAGFNSNKYDVPLLVEEFIRAGINFDTSTIRLVDVQNIYHKLEQRNLTAAYRFYCHKELTDAHTAMADTEATYEVLKAQLDKYDELQPTVEFLSKFSQQKENVDLAGRLIMVDGYEVINFGKYKGQRACDVLRRDYGYFSWIQQGDFTQDTKRCFMQIKLKYSL